MSIDWTMVPESVTHVGPKGAWYKASPGERLHWFGASGYWRPCVDPDLPQGAVRRPVPDDTGWTPWSGGDQPVGDDVRVEMRYPDGTTDTDKAVLRHWDHDRGTILDIIAYRLAPVDTTPDTPRQQLYKELDALFDGVESREVTMATAIFSAGESLARWWVAAVGGDAMATPPPPPGVTRRDPRSPPPPPGVACDT